MNFLGLVRKRRSIRNYEKKEISLDNIEKILEAGRYGPSLAGHQPARFVVITGSRTQTKVSRILFDNFGKLGIVGRTIFFPSTLKAIKSAKILIAVYRSSEFVDLVFKFSKLISKSRNNVYLSIARDAELEATAAAIQNMVLEAEVLGLGSCWLHVPIFFAKEINRVLGVDGELVAIITIGHPDEEGRRSSRDSISKVVTIIKR